MKSKLAKTSLEKAIGSAALCLLASCWLAAPVAAKDEQSWSSAYQQGEQAINSQTPGQAEVFFRRALELAKKQTKDPASIDKCQLQLASSLKLQDKTGEARNILQSMLTRVTKVYGADDARLEPVLMELGSIEESAGNHSVAMSYYNRTLALTEKNYGPYSPAAAGALHSLGRLNGKAGNKDAAATNYKRAITILSKEPNLEAAEQLKVVMHDYSDLMKGTDQSDTDLIKDFQKDVFKNDGGKPSSDANSGSGNKSQWQQQSESMLQSSRSSETDENTQVALRGLHLPSSDDTLKPAFKVVSDTVFSQSRYRMSESQYQRMIATDIDSLGPNHPSVANDLNGLAQLYIAQGKYSDAKPLLSRALSIYQPAYGNDNALTINTLAALASVEFHLRNFDQSVRLYRLALTGAQATLGPNSLETAQILNGLAYLYFHRGDLEKSSTFYQWAVASTERAVGENNPLLAACLKDYAQVLRRLDKDAKASEIEARAGSILEKPKQL